MAVLPTGIGPVTGGYNIERSLRFNSADSAYLNRTFAASSGTTDTFSFWVKRSSLGSAQSIFETSNGVDTSFGIVFNSSNALEFYDYVTGYRMRLVTSQVFRDVGAWYHIVCYLNTTNATAANRAKIYINGTEVTAFSTATYPTQNFSLLIGTSKVWGIGAIGNVVSQYFNGYITEINFIDGQALTPSSFGETDSATGVWKPKAYSSTYGTNGFFLKFADNSGTTSTTIGKDSSGNGNNWTPNNFSVTAGAGNDSLVDTPTAYGTDTGAGGSVRGNYATLNPLARNSGTLANGNLDFSTGATYQYGSGTIAIPSSGKWIFEVTFNTTPTTNNYNSCGVVTSSFDRTGSFTSTGAYGVEDVSTFGQRFVQNGIAQGSITLPAGTVIQCLIDRDAGTLTFTKNGTLQTGTGSTVTLPASSVELFAVVGQYSNSVTANFGQRAFAYTAPSGFKALVTTNLPTPTIGATSTTQANDYFDATLYTGTGATQSITNSGSMQPDFVWFKRRSITENHWLTDSVRGSTKGLFSNLTDAEATRTDQLTSFNSNGFTLGADAAGYSNASGQSYVAWNWNAGGSNATNTSGTITSTVRANTTSGFSIVTYTGTGSNATVGHGLGVAPQMIICMNRGGGNYFPVYHVTNTASKTQWLQLTNAASSDTAYWQGVTPTTSVFSIGTNTNVNGSTQNYVAYCFAPVAGYSAFGSYTGNGSTDGPFVYTGFRPRFVMWKNTTTAGYNWEIIDTARDTYNVMLNVLGPNTSAAESAFAGPPYLDAVSNGFKIRTGSASVGYQNINNNNDTYIYAAFAESPFKYSLAR